MPTPSRPHADDLPAPNDTAFIALAAKDRHTTQGALARHVLALSTRLAAVEATPSTACACGYPARKVHTGGKDCPRTDARDADIHADHLAAEAERIGAEREIAALRAKVDELMRDRAEAIDRDALLWAIVALTDVLEVTWKDPGMATRAVAAIDAIVRSGTPTATLTAERLAEAIEKCPFWIATGELRPDGTHESMHEDDAAEEILRHLGPVAPPAVPEAGDTAATIAPSERQVVLIERRPDGSMVALTDSAPWPVGALMPMLRWPPPSPPGYTHGAERAAPVAAPTPEVARTVAVAALRGLIAKWRRMTDRAGYTVEAGLAEDGCANDLESLIEAALSDACANSPARPCSR